MKYLLSSAGMAIILALAMVMSSLAADYPSKPITLITPMPPGGSQDLHARGFASVAEKLLGQPVVVVNKPGAAGMIGGLAGAQAAPDGYTLTVGSANFASAIEWEIANGRKPPFTRHDFAPICSFTISPTLLVVPFDSPWKTLADFIKDSKDKAGQYAYCSGGLYGATHLPAELLTRAAGLKVRHVPYSGGGPCLAAVVGKHVDFATQLPPTSIPFIRGNKMRALAVVGNKRLKSIPDIPSTKELGIDAEYYTWTGILAPKNTPLPIVEKLREVARKVAEDRYFIDIIEKPGDEVYFMNGDELARYWETESETLAKLMAELAKEAPKK